MFKNKTKKDFKKLLKKYRTLNEVLDLLKDFLEVYPKGILSGIVLTSKLGINTKIYKVIKFRY